MERRVTIYYTVYVLIPVGAIIAHAVQIMEKVFNQRFSARFKLTSLTINMLNIFRSPLL